jgi:Protein of unknown function (DUF2442)
MTFSAKPHEQRQRAYVPTTALAKSVTFDEHAMAVLLTDGRIISLPLIWFPRLQTASPEARTQYAIGTGGRSVHWEALDEDLSVAQFLAGADSASA